MQQRTTVLLVILVALFGVYYLFDGGAVGDIEAMAGVDNGRKASGGDARSGKAGMSKYQPNVWPPALGRTYPDLELLDRDGNPVRLSKWQGKVILLEPVGMDCPACQGFAGANDIGAYGGAGVQKSAWAIEKLLQGWGNGVELGDRDLVYVQLILYDLHRGPPTPEDAALWDDHFSVSERHGHVLVPKGDLRNRASFALIPGFQLIDRDFVLRYDASGHQPRHGYDELLGAMGGML